MLHRHRALIAVALLGGLAPAAARASDPLPEAWAGTVQQDQAEVVQPADVPAPGGLTFLGYFQARAAIGSIITTSPVFDGQVVGVLGGSNGTTVYAPGQTDLDGDGTPDEDLGNSAYIEQRLNTFFTYAPPTLNGRAALTAGFEVDFLYGDASYGVGGNEGGGFGADQVNLQTRRLHVTFSPELGARHRLDVVAGLQFVGDGVYNPAAATLDDLMRTGGGLRFFGSEAAGVSMFGRVDDASGERLRYRLGGYTLAEGGVSRPDDVALYMLDVQVAPVWNGRLGAHAWVLRDSSGGEGGLLGYGATSALSGLQGGPMLDFRRTEDEDVEVDADLVWLALDGGLNHRLTQGRLGASGLALVNLGRLYVGNGQPDVPVQGWLLDGEVRYRWAPGAGSILRAEALVNSRDGTDREAYTGVVTGNSYGIAGAMWSSHGAMILFPDPQSINRQISVVSDVSNGGSGLLGLSASAGWDLVPSRLNLTLGGAHAASPSVELSASEVNARLTWAPWLFWRLSAGAAAVTGTAFDADPWLVQVYLDWLTF